MSNRADQTTGPCSDAKTDKPTAYSTQQMRRLSAQMPHCFASTAALLYAADEIDYLRAALQRLADCDWVITPGDRMDAVRKIARDALGGYLP